MPEQYASRLKIGVVTPSTNTTLEPDSHSLCPTGVTAHTARISIQNKKISGAAEYDEHVKAMREGIGSAIAQVVTCAPDHLIMGVALEAFWGGLEGSKQLQKELEESAGVPISMGSLAMDTALKALGIKKIAVLTPHMPAGDDQVRNWFEEAGYEIVSFVGLKCASPRAIAEVLPSEIESAITELNTASSEAIIQVGTNLQFRHQACSAETALGKPVLALNSVMMWDALRRHQISDKISGAGILWETC
jgi:maleate isomerase